MVPLASMSVGERFIVVCINNGEVRVGVDGIRLPGTPELRVKHPYAAIKKDSRHITIPEVNTSYGYAHERFILVNDLCVRYNAIMMAGDKDDSDN